MLQAVADLLSVIGNVGTILSEFSLFVVDVVLALPGVDSFAVGITVSSGLD